jgi:acetyl-CoA acetyltransferase
MVAHITAAARTPWALRHGALATIRPEKLLQTTLVAAVTRAGLEPETIDRVLVACDTTVGAQDLNIGRRAVMDLGWDAVPALTIDGQGVGGLALIDLAASLPGRTIVAGVDATSLVPPGAGQVRDYGRPTHDLPEVEWLEVLATHHHLTRQDLDKTADSFRVATTGMTDSIVTVRPGTAAAVEVDCCADMESSHDLAPLTSPTGVQTAAHIAPYADGSAAVVVDAGGTGGRKISCHNISAGRRDTLIDRMAHLATPTDRTSPQLVAEHSAVVISALLTKGTQIAEDLVPSTLALGSTPSIDGLRTLVDVFHQLDQSASVLSRGSGGQIVRVSIAAR